MVLRCSLYYQQARKESKQKFCNPAIVVFSVSLQSKTLCRVVYTHHLPFLTSYSSLKSIQKGLQLCQSAEMILLKVTKDLCYQNQWSSAASTLLIFSAMLDTIDHFLPSQIHLILSFNIWHLTLRLPSSQLASLFFFFAGVSSKCGQRLKPQEYSLSSLSLGKLIQSKGLSTIYMPMIHPFLSFFPSLPLSCRLKY